MKKLLVAALGVSMLVGCGLPMEGEEGFDPKAGTAQQGLNVLDGAPLPQEPNAPTLNTSLFKNPQESVLLAPAFQEQNHLTNPIRRGDCH